MKIYQISDGANLSASLSTLGARIIDIEFVGLSMVCRYKKLADFETDRFYMGATVGPIANRLAGGALKIYDQHYQLPQNEHPNSLHSGNVGYHYREWQLGKQTANSIEFVLELKQQDQGVPGNMTVHACYAIKQDCLSVRYWASCDQTSYLNLTNHVYLNLNKDVQDIRNHEFVLHARELAVVDEHMLPTGKIVPLPRDMPYSLSEPYPIEALSGKADNHLMVDDMDHTTVKLFAEVHSPSSQVSLKVSSTSPGFQFYTAHFLDSPLQPFGGFCIEPQHTPNAINQPQFYAPLIDENTPFEQITTFDFKQRSPS